MGSEYVIRYEVECLILQFRIQRIFNKMIVSLRSACCKYMILEFGILKFLPTVFFFFFFCQHFYRKMTLQLDIEECAKTVGETIANNTFFDVYEDFDTMIDIIKKANLDANQGTYIFNEIKSRKFNFDDMVQIFKSINVHFDSSNEEGIDAFFEFIRSTHKTLKFRPLKQIYNYI